MSTTTILRGFKVLVDTLDAFIEAHRIMGTYGYPPFFDQHPDKDELSVLLYKKIVAAGGTADKNKFRVILPHRHGDDFSRVAYVTYAWLSIYAHFELNLDEQLPSEIPQGFEELRTEILSFENEEHLEINKIPNNGKMGLYMVYTGGGYGTYFPKEMQARKAIPQRCDQCDMTFDDERKAFTARQKHRISAHGAKEELSPLLEV